MKTFITLLLTVTLAIGRIGTSHGAYSVNHENNKTTHKMLNNLKPTGEQQAEFFNTGYKRQRTIINKSIIARKYTTRYSIDFEIDYIPLEGSGEYLCAFYLDEEKIGESGISGTFFSPTSWNKSVSKKEGYRLS